MNSKGAGRKREKEIAGNQVACHCPSSTRTVCCVPRKCWHCSDRSGPVRQRVCSGIASSHTSAANCFSGMLPPAENLSQA